MGSKRSVLTIVVGLALVGALALAFRPEPVPVDLERVTRGPLRVTVDEEGKTRIRERYVVAAPLAGKLRRIELRAGDRVAAAKTILATIDPVEPELLDPRAAAQAEARVRAAQAAEQRVRAELERSRSAAELAAKELERQRRLYETEVLARQELDATEQRATATAEELRAGRFSVRIAGFELEQARAALLRTRRTSTGGAEWRLEVPAPIDGSVLRVFQESETVVAPGTPLVEVGDTSDLEVDVEVLSRDAVRIARGAPVLFEQWGGDRPLRGRVRVIEPSAFTKVSALGVEEQRVHVIADLEEPASARPELGDAYRVEARIVEWEAASVLKVPASALFRHDGRWAVFRLAGHRAELRGVGIGRTNDVEAELRSGLELGDLVIAHPSDKIEDGTRVVRR
jgi:HlyD family secretion protein